MDTIAEWWKTFKAESEEVLVLLIDTDLIGQFNRLKEKYNSIKNIYVFNHVEFQQFMIDKYYKV